MNTKQHNHKPPMGEPIIFLRHGETEWNIKGKYQGDADIEINEIGKQNSKENGRWIQKFLKEKNIKKINCMVSPLKRTQKSLEIVIDNLQVEIKKIEMVQELREINVGHWQGLTTIEVKEKFYEERKNRKKNRWRFKPKNGESLNDRAKTLIEKIQGIKQPTIVITHAGIIRIIQYYLGNMEPELAAQFTINHRTALVWNNQKLKEFNT